MPRTWLAAVVLTLLVPVASYGQARDAATVVIVHGAWGGGWDWRTVESELRSRGRAVFRPTLTGLGERNHLASPDVGLDTHVTDIANLIVWERLEDVLLVGHSYGGMVITGVAERIPDRIGHLVYVDAFVPYDGECALSVPSDLSRTRTCDVAEAAFSPLVELVDEMLLPRWVEDGAPPPTDVPHPVKTLTDPLELEGRPGRGRPASYILTRAAPAQADGFDWAAARAADLGWLVHELVSGHNPQRDAPSELADLFISLH